MLHSQKLIIQFVEDNDKKIRIMIGDEEVEPKMVSGEVHEGTESAIAEATAYLQLFMPLRWKPAPEEPEAVPVVKPTPKSRYALFS